MMRSTTTLRVRLADLKSATDLRSEEMAGIQGGHKTYKQCVKIGNYKKCVIRRHNHKSPIPTPHLPF